MFCIVVLGLLSVSLAEDLNKAFLGQLAVPQNPPIWDALDGLRGRVLTVQEIQDIIAAGEPGTSYPINAEAPEPGVDCEKTGLPGYFADDGPISRCQAFYRCDVNGQRTAFLCPNGTLFNQITLICDAFFNVDCKNSAKFATYSNSRLYIPGAHLHDDQLIYNPTGGAPAPLPAPPAAAMWNPSWNRAVAGKTNNRITLGGTQGQEEPADAAAAVDAVPANNRALSAQSAGVQNQGKSGVPAPVATRLTFSQGVKKDP